MVSPCLTWHSLLSSFFLACLISIDDASTRTKLAQAWMSPTTTTLTTATGRRQRRRRSRNGLPSFHSRQVDSSTQQCRRSSSLSSSSSSTTNMESYNHIFHDYDKPLVLVGCSGAGDELERLAMAFVRDQARATTTTGATLAATTALALQQQQQQDNWKEAATSFDSNSFSSNAPFVSSFTCSTSSSSSSSVVLSAGLVPLIGYDATRGWFVLPLEELKRSIVSQKYSWPDVIVVDVAQLDAFVTDVAAAAASSSTTTINNKDTATSSSSSSSALEFYVTQALKLLYEELQLLCVYVNVDANNSRMKATARQRQERMEATMIQYTDYELCIRHEGLDPATIVAQQLLTKLQQEQQAEQQQEATTTTIHDPALTNIITTDDPLSFTTSSSSSSPEAKAMLQQAIQQQEDGWNHIEWELQRLIARARLTSPIPGDGTTMTTTTSTTTSTTTTSTTTTTREDRHALPILQRPDNAALLTMGPHTFFLSLSVPHIEQIQPYIPNMCLDVDALEYRTDLLACRNSRFDLLYGMQQLRSYSRPHVVRVPALPCPNGKVLDDVMPIVYTVRTCHQAGTYPDDPEVGIPNMFTLLTWGLRGGVEVLDVESAWDPPRTKRLLDLVQERYASQILGSHHVVGTTVTLEDAVALFQQCALQGRAHGAKLVLSIDNEQQDQMAYQAGLIATSLAESASTPVIPHIALILGTIGQFSRIINFPFTPVTHESLPTPAAPGQLTANEIMATRILTKLVTRKLYCILGHNIAYSVSPQMHNAAFAATRLPHQYHRADVATVEEFISSDFFQSPDFGGASVTIPHKQAIIPQVDVMSEAARAIGSVNTLIVKEELLVEDDNEQEGNEANGDDEGAYQRVIYGDNTDWKGIYKPLQRKLGNKVNTATDVCLIVGAGGTARAAAYAAQKLGLRRIYYNRTPEKAQELADSFGGVVVSSLDERETHTDVSTQCLGQALRNLSGANDDTAKVRVVICTLPAAANFELPSWLFQSSSSSSPSPSPPMVVFDVNYKPYYTPLLLQAESKGCPVVRGSEMLWEQGVGQFELWTERTAPYGVMKQVVLENCLPTESFDDDDGDDEDDDIQSIEEMLPPVTESTVD